MTDLPNLPTLSFTELARLFVKANDSKNNVLFDLVWLEWQRRWPHEPLTVRLFDELRKV